MSVGHELAGCPLGHELPVVAGEHQHHHPLLVTTDVQYCNVIENIGSNFVQESKKFLFKNLQKPFHQSTVHRMSMQDPIRINQGSDKENQGSDLDQAWIRSESSKDQIWIKQGSDPDQARIR